MSRRDSCSFGSFNATNTADTKTLLLFVGQTRSLTFIFEHQQQIVTIFQTAI